MLSDSLGYQALNARAAKASLAQRTQILEDSQTATKLAINKRRNVERLKGSSSINTSRVDDAITEMDEVSCASNVSFRSIAGCHGCPGVLQKRRRKPSGLSLTTGQ